MALARDPGAAGSERYERASWPPPLLRFLLAAALPAARSMASFFRYDSPSIFTISALWVRRSTRAVMQPALTNTCSHSRNDLLVVITVERCRGRLLMTSNRRAP